jgi:hypothetical protein
VRCRWVAATSRGSKEERAPARAASRQGGQPKVLPGPHRNEHRRCCLWAEVLLWGPARGLQPGGAAAVQRQQAADGAGIKGSAAGAAGALLQRDEVAGAAAAAAREPTCARQEAQAKLLTQNKHTRTTQHCQLPSGARHFPRGKRASQLKAADKRRASRSRAKLLMAEAATDRWRLRLCAISRP